MEQNILSLLQQDPGSSSSEVKTKYANDVLRCEGMYPLKSKKVSAKKMKKKIERPEIFSSVALLTLIDQAFDDKHKCLELIKVMKTGGTQYQQLNEEHLSRLIIKLLKMLSQNRKNG